LTLNVAAIDPAPVGLNTTLIVQDVPIATDVPQVLFCENCWGLRPASVILVMGNAALLVLVTVTICAALAVRCN
jgi:hypothetical protein